MKQLQITAPHKYEDEVQEVLSDYSSDISSSEVERDEKKFTEFKVTCESDQIDELSEELKGLKNLKPGDLSIRVLTQDSLIEKGVKTRGSSSMLSQQEIYSKAQQFSGFNRSEWGLIAVSSAIAAFGLALNNIIVVVGAMMLAPILSPFVSGAMSLAVGDKSLMKQSLTAGLESSVIAVLIAYISVMFFPVTVNPTLELVATPGLLMIILSLLVGSAAALTFATGLRDQVAGVAVAIALVPPLAAMGIGLKMQNPFFVANAGSVVAINILSIILSGSITFKLLGLKPATYYRKREAKEMRYILPLVIVSMLLIAAPIAYSSYHDYDGFVVEQQVQKTAESYFGSNLISVDVENSEARIMVVGTYNNTEFGKMLPDNVSLDLVELQRTD